MTISVKHLGTQEERRLEVRDIMLGVAEGDNTTLLFLTDGTVETLCPADAYSVSAVVEEVPPEPFPPPTLEEIKRTKLTQLSQVCNTTITAGCSVTLSDGTTGNLSMTDEDQINLLSALAAVQAGVLAYPYHLDGSLCRVYSAEDIQRMGTAATGHKLYHTTYCNHLNVWVRRCETVEAVEAITYGVALPDDLAANMAEVLEHAT